MKIIPKADKGLVIPTDNTSVQAPRRPNPLKEFLMIMKRFQLLPVERE